MARWWQFQNKVDPIVPQFFAGTAKTAIVIQQPVPVQSETRFQYDAFADPTDATSFVPRFVSTWFREWTPPPKPKISAGLAVALIASGLTWTPFTPPSAVTDMKWDSRWSEPVRVKPALGQYLQDVGTPDVPLPPPVLVSQWSYPWTDPVRFRTLGPHLQDVGTPDVPLPQPPTTTNDTRWIYPWSEPTRRTGLGTHLQDVGAPDVPNPPPVLSSQWYAPWTDPTRIKITVQYQQSLAWGNFTPTAAPGNGTVVQTMQDVAVQYEYRLQYQALAEPVTTPTPSVFTDIRWFEPWSEPVRTKPGLLAAQQQFFAQNIFPIPPAAIADARWLAPWAEPVRQKAGLAVQLQQASVDPPEFPNLPTPSGAATTTALSSPVFYKGRFIYQSVTKPVFIAGDITNVGRWFEPWSEPVRTRAFHASQQQALAWSTFTPAPAVVNLGWFQPLSSLQPQKITVSSATFSFMAVDKALTNFWYSPWPDFAYPKKSILAAQQQTLAWANFTPAPVVFTDTRWIYPWSEPVRTRTFGPQLQDVGAPDVPNPPPVLSSQWYEPWVDPVRQKIGLPATQQQALAWSNFTPPVTDIRWFEPWVDPVRVKLGLLAGIQQAYSSQIQPPPVLISQWNYAWSEPVRQKPGLQASLQQFTTPATPPQPNFTRTINWYQPYSLPVWPKKGLRVEYQSPFVLGTPVIKTQVTVTMSAFEINLDSALFGILVYNSTTPVPVAVAGANVTITEIPAITGAAASIEET